MEKAENRRVAMSIGFALTEAAQQGAKGEGERQREGARKVANQLRMDVQLLVVLIGCGINLQ